MAGTVNISGQITGVPGGPITIGPFGLPPNPDNLVQIDVFAFADSTPVAIFIPAWATGLIIVPPATNAETITLQGAPGDTGFAVSKTSPTILTFDGTTAQNVYFVLGSGSSDEFTFLLF